MQIEDGTTAGYRAQVNANNHLATFSTTETKVQVAGFAGDAFNINTGLVALTTTDSAVLYFKNDEVEDYLITAIAVGIGTVSGTISDSAEVILLKNATGGDIISDASAVDMNSNFNFGSPKVLTSTSLAYKGKAGGTMTGGTDHALFYMNGNSRLFAPIDIVIQRGSSIGIKIDLNTSGGGNVYATIIGHLRDPNLD